MANPTEPPATTWVFPPIASADDDGIVGIGADLEPGTLLAAYRAGIFPTPVGPDNVMAWWSPDPRAIIPLDGVHVSGSLRRSLNRFTVSFDTDFSAVVAGCADPTRDHGWITEEMSVAYERLHELGWAHSVEVWTDEGSLAGGLYGVAVGGLFAGESMFHRVSDASKVAMVRIAERLMEQGFSLFDVQWQTPHLASMGAIEVERAEYLELLAQALAGPSRPRVDASR
ncbi:MAG: leucyl/phenylalanyl-tRNA--protein transferase [Acidimicrobiia bacterium]